MSTQPKRKPNPTRIIPPEQMIYTATIRVPRHDDPRTFYEYVLEAASGEMSLWRHLIIEDPDTEELWLDDEDTKQLDLPLVTLLQLLRDAGISESLFRGE